MRTSEDAHRRVVQDLAAERANALGRAGTRLEEAIDTWRLMREVGHASGEQLVAALTGVRDALWALLVQRECAGFRGDNLATIRRHYDVPEAAVRRL